MSRLLNALLLITLISLYKPILAQRGYFDAPYKRYEADSAILSNGAFALARSYSQVDLQSEASDQVCVDMSGEKATIQFNFTEAADGMVIRYSVPDGETGVIGIYDNDYKIASLTLTSKWSWEYLWNNGDPNNVGIKNKNPRMRFDEVRYKLPEKSSNIKLVRESGNITIDFIEMELVPDKVSAPAGAAIYSGDGSTLQAFIDANGSNTIYIPEGVYNINSQLYIGVDNTKLQGAGMWYTQLNFTVKNASNGGLRANAGGICYADLYITTDMTTRTNGYAGIHGVYTQNSEIRNVWVEHCATGAWIGQYVASGPSNADGFIISNCRFRDTYADGINLCKGTSNAIVEHCNFRNNGDDGMAIWCAEGMECINNTFRYNTVENGWRAAGAALYGGKDNKFYNILIKDNIDIGITISNNFAGAGFDSEGAHDFHNITLTKCSTFNSIYNDRVGAINIVHSNQAGTKVQNIRMYNIDIIDSKCDAIRIARSSGDGIFDLRFENVNVNGTGVEYPYNNIDQSNSLRGFAVIFDNYPLGAATHCSLNYANLGGNSNGEAFSTSQKGSFRWNEITGCEYVSVTGFSLSPADTSISGGKTFKLVPVFIPSDATNKIISFSSANPQVASVTYDGIVTALAKGETTITAITQDGNISSTSNIKVTSDPTVYYKIKNRWQSTYLYDGGDRVKYSDTSNEDIYLWKINEKDGVKLIQNISTGDYMHIENLLGYVQCSPVAVDSLSSGWSLEDAGNGFVRIKSEWETNNYIHVENLQGQAQYGLIESSWWSAMWELEPFLATTGLKELNLNKTVKVYPNPSDGNFNLLFNSINSGDNISISVYNLSGQLMYSRSYNLNNVENRNINIKTGSFFTPGNYLLVAKGKSFVEKLKLVIVR